MVGLISRAGCACRGMPPHVLQPVFRPMPLAAPVEDSPELWAAWEPVVRALRVHEDLGAVVR